MSKRPASLFLLLLCLCCLILPPRAPAQGRVVSVRVDVVTRVEGEVRVRWHGIGEPELLKPGDVLSKGDLLLTGDNGRAELTLTYDSYLLVAPLSQLWIYEVGNDRIHLDILRGEVSATIQGNIGNNPLVLDTPPAELDVVKRGHYVVQVAADGSAEAYVEAGEMRFADSNGATVRLKKHKRVRFAAPARR
jgi:FecR protein